MLIFSLISLFLLGAMAAAGVSAALGLRAYAARSAGSHSGARDETWSLADLPPTSVVIPCKGDDGTLMENLQTMVQQEHPWIEYILVTATADDPAARVFDELKRRHGDRRIKAIVAGIPDRCSQQNNNQVAGAAAADPSSRIIVVMDSDGQADKRFIAKLTAPLKNPAVGATSGYRWYQPRWSRPADLLRTVWNAGGFAFLVNPRTSFVWGGAMAVRRETFDSAGVAQVWACALSDDMTMSRRLKERGLALQFVPECIVVSREKDTLTSAVRWTNRQTLVTRFYNRPFWLMASVFHILGNALGWGLLAWGLSACFIAGDFGVTGHAERLALLAGAIWVSHLWIYAMLMVGPLERLLQPLGIVLGARRWLLVAIAPLASVLQGINSLNSFTTRKIRWAGVTYHIENHETMHVV